MQPTGRVPCRRVRERDPLHRAPLRSRARGCGQRARSTGGRGRAPGPRPRARGGGGGSELRPWIERRLTRPGRRSRGSRSGRARVPYLGTQLELLPQAGRARVHRARRSACWSPRATPARRSSATTAAPGARGDRAAPGPRHALAGLRYRDLSDPRAAHALGLVLGRRAHELQLAPVAGARARARLRRLARGLPPGDPRPLAPLLGARGAPLAGHTRGDDRRSGYAKRRDAGALP